MTIISYASYVAGYFVVTEFFAVIMMMTAFHESPSAIYNGIFSAVTDAVTKKTTSYMSPSLYNNNNNNNNNNNDSSNDEYMGVFDTTSCADNDSLTTVTNDYTILGLRQLKLVSYNTCTTSSIVQAIVATIFKTPALYESPSAFYNGDTNAPVYFAVIDAEPSANFTKTNADTMTNILRSRCLKLLSYSTGTCTVFTIVQAIVATIFISLHDGIYFAVADTVTKTKTDANQVTTSLSSGNRETVPK